jgi:hypothetical protein
MDFRCLRTSYGENICTRRERIQQQYAYRIQQQYAYRIRNSGEKAQGSLSCYIHILGLNDPSLYLLLILL